MPLILRWKWWDFCSRVKQLLPLVYVTDSHQYFIVMSEYHGYPILVNFSSLGKSLSWMAATQKDGKKSSFTIQYLQNRKRCIWIDVNKTSELSISIFSLSQYIPEHTVKTCSVRVCVSGPTPFNNVSCSREHKVYSSKSLCDPIF